MKLAPLLLLLAAGGLSAFEAEQGLASWYGGKFQGRRTASGEPFDTFQFTAAHRTLPFGTRVLVTNLENGKAVTVRINDRGPFIPGRIIDLSLAAAEAIGLTAKGLASVRLEPLPQEGEKGFSGGDGRLFLLQLGSFRVPANAERLLARLRQAGFPEAEIEASGGFSRVLIRRLSRSQLSSLTQRLEAIGFADALVRAEP